MKFEKNYSHVQRKAPKHDLHNTDTSIYAKSYLHMSLSPVYQRQEAKFLPSPFFVNMTAPISVSLAFGLHSYASTVNATVRGWPSGSTVCFTPMLFPEF